jgi:hypothetical protein
MQRERPGLVGGCELSIHFASEHCSLGTVAYLINIISNYIRLYTIP